MAADSRELVRSVFASRRAARAPFIPAMGTAAARLMQVPVRKFFHDATALANTLQACQKLFNYDGIIMVPDDTLEAEALGSSVSFEEGTSPGVLSPVLKDAAALDSLDISSIETKGRIPVVLEASRRLAQTAGRDAAMLGAVTGPVTLGCRLMGDDLKIESSGVMRKLADVAGNIALAFARAYGEMKFDALIVADKELPRLEPDLYGELSDMLSTLRNLVNFYDSPLVLHTGTVPERSLPALSRLPVDVFSLSGPLAELAHLSPRPLGAAVTSPVWLDDTEMLEQALAGILGSAANRPVFITSEFELPPATPAAHLHRAVQILLS